MSDPVVSIIIPAYNRIDLLQYTLESVRRATGSFDYEIIIVDDGSDVAIEPQLKGWDDLPIRFIRQENQGCVVAKQTGFLASQGKYVQFLDSDDLIHREKLVSQIKDLEDQHADVSYCDQGTVFLHGSYDDLVFKTTRIVECDNTPCDLYLKVRPAPQTILFRREYLKRNLENPWILPHRDFGSVGEIWIYYNLSIFPAKIVKTTGYFSFSGISGEERLTDHWEKLGISSLKIMEAFGENCPDNLETMEARTEVAANAFHAWRLLPNKLPADLEVRFLNLFHSLPQPPLKRLGGRKFQTLARMLGPVRAASLFRKLQRPDYDRIRTLSDEQLNSLLVSS